MSRLSIVPRATLLVAAASLTCLATGCDVKGLLPRKATPPAAQPVTSTQPSNSPGGAAPTAPSLSAAAPLTSEQRSMVNDLGRWQAATSDQRRALGELLGSRVSGFSFVKLESVSCGGRQNEMAVFRQDKCGLEFVLVPGGGFTMGSPDSEPGHKPDEVAHPVRLTKGFLASRTEVTQRAYSEIAGDDPSKFKSPDNPVETVTHSQAMKFARRVLCELPSEAQWEYLCRAGSTDAYTFGGNADALGEYAWFAGNAGGTTHGVGLKKPNAFGLFDVHGNVFEWTRDSEGEYAAGAATDPETDPKVVHKMTRGGACISQPPAVRCAQRFPDHGSDKNFALGFRVVKTLDLE